jgi:DUF4097 and DUF4098 domain-containing protein YvlB
MTRFTCIAGLLALAAASGLPERAHAQRYRTATRIDTTVALGRGADVSLSVISGTIIVTTWDRAEARVRASIENDGQFEYAFSPNGVRIRAISDEDARRDTGDRKRRVRRDEDVGEARIEITVPVGARVDASAVSGDVSVRGTRAPVEVSAVSGDVTVTDATQRVNVNSVSGDVVVERVDGDLRVSLVSGNLRLGQLTGDLRVTSVSSDLTLGDVRARELRVKTVSGNVDFRGPIAPDGTYEFTTHSGDITLLVPSNLNATVGLRTYSGELDTDFPLTLRPSADRERRGRLMEFTLGSGGRARISVETFSGDINLRRADGRGSNRE